MHSSPRPLFDAFIFAQLRSAASIQTRMSSISEVPAELAIKSQSLEANKKPGVQYALTPDGVELPIVDVTHPIFALSLTPAEQQERMQAFVRETQKLEQLAPPNWRRRRAPSRLAGFHHVGSKGRLESGTLSNVPSATNSFWSDGDTHRHHGTRNRPRHRPRRGRMNPM
jgi:hypothetical protein